MFTINCRFLNRCGNTEADEQRMRSTPAMRIGIFFYSDRAEPALFLPKDHPAFPRDAF
ncbi:MAG TPA: hypothetical protein VFL92_04275 [Sphingomonas sp.]|nr:hypothetical protein [Sphingomonas sp.]